MTTRRILRPLTLAATLLMPTAVLGQDAFGSAVAVPRPDEVVVLKPGAARGPSRAEVFRYVDGAWIAAEALGGLEGGFPGETLSPAVSVDASGSVLLLGAGDPGGALAGHLYVRDGTAWRGVGRIPLDPVAGLPAGLPAGGLDMGTLMALMGPPARAAVLSPEGDRMAAAGGTVGPGRVRVLLRIPRGWVVEAELSAPADVEVRGLSGPLAFDGYRVLAGAPEMGRGGGALLWEFDPGTGAWRAAARFPPAPATGAEPGRAAVRLGTAVVLAGDEALVGDPGRDEVRRYRPNAQGNWYADGVLGPATDGTGGAAGGRMAAFGAALAATPTHLVVGAPLAGEVRGEVRVYRRGGDDAWTPLARLAPDDVRPGDAFGAAVAIAHGRIVVGAPGAHGGQGRAAVYDLADLEAGPTWLDAGEPLERVAGETVRCAEGTAEGFDCDAVDLVSFTPLSAMGAEPGERVSDIWGWTDPETRREYVLAGRTAGMAVMDITDASNPVFVGLMPGNPSGARDIKVYRDHAFLTGDGAGDHGLLVFDLTRLRDVASGEMPAIFEPDARYDLVASAHNLIIDPESGFAYTVGTNTGGESCGGGLHMIDIREPLSPTFAGCFTDSAGLIWSGRTHDAQCTVYRGPDEAYQGRQLCFASNETLLRIVDVTDKANPVAISAMSHPGTAYVHQGWLTEDHRYLYVNDELDEIVGTTDRTRTLIWDVTELEDPVLVAEHLGPDQATDHNLYIKGTRAYLANYQAGLHVLDISDPEAPVEIGWFDTTPYGANPPGFGGGAWTAFPFFESGMVVVSSINEGLFVLRPRPIVP